ncbi:MAG: hypothetical protein M1812_001690 [Candelaria pacifica]|nr:MAG: hypothetical protein M1812_001690 [Candelaria pacifica]
MSIMIYSLLVASFLTMLVILFAAFKLSETGRGNPRPLDEEPATSVEAEAYEVFRYIGFDIPFPPIVDLEAFIDIERAFDYGGVAQAANPQPDEFSRQGFRGPSNRSNNQPKPGNPQNQSSASGQSSNTAPPLPSMETSPSAASLSYEVDNAGHQSNHPNLGLQGAQTPINRKPMPFFREEFSTFIVKGNFMTLAALPKHVDLGEWLAHQIVEQNRLLGTMVTLVREPDHNNHGLPCCNSTTCPTMKAAETTYSWLDANGKPTKVPAAQYLALVQKWVNSKVHNPAIFPTDSASLTTHSAGSTYASGSLSSPQSAPIAAGPTSLTTPLSTLAGSDWIGKSSGFPETFPKTCCDIMRQMFRCYAHLYWSHWTEPFYHLNQNRQLNSCFVHFMTVAKLFGMLTDKDVEPMQPLIDIWLRTKAIPAEAVPGLTTEKADAVMAGAATSPMARTS